MPIDKLGRRALKQIVTWNDKLHLVTDETPQNPIHAALMSADAKCSVIGKSA